MDIFSSTGASLLVLLVQGLFAWALWSLRRAFVRAEDYSLHVQRDARREAASARRFDALEQHLRLAPDTADMAGLHSELAALRGERCRGLLTLASNPCFVAGADWPYGMDEATFDAFVAGCRDHPAATLKRFSLLCSQGSSEARGLARQLQAAAPHLAPEVLLAGLEVLGNFDGRSALQRFAGPQLHLLAGADALVPAEVAGELLSLQPDIEVGLIEEVSHAFPLERPHEVAAAIHAFITEAGDV